MFPIGLSIDIKQPEPSPFEQEPELIGFYHWPQSIRAMHSHPDYIELNFILSGNGTYIVGNDLCHAQDGDVIVYDSGVLHDENLVLHQLTDNCCIAVRGLKLPGQRVNALLPEKVRPRIPCQAIAEELRTLFAIIKQSLQHPHGYHTANMAARTIVHLVYDTMQERAATTTKKENILIQQALSYIHLHYTANLRVTDIARAIHVSPDYLTHIFRKTTNYTVIQYIQRRRIGKAQSLLIYTDLPLLDIAARTGFEDSNYFSRVFHKITGVPPLRFRRLWREASGTQTAG
ncbi:AraC family transcriptional regulator [uncultured Mitsuokella sp.]|uniref:AraC family transcriptional regulator n=1 Tax=uncultured Mitsuokella sp. TaxID=453120 RepID=UPI0025DBAA76|nr:AraC family transcriptional regulator [uncultured Mitsuokella sp.]